MSRINPTESESRWALDYTQREELRLLRAEIVRINAAHDESIEQIASDLTIKRLESERLSGVIIKKLREDNADLLEQIIALQSKYLTDPCQGCDGRGSVSVVIAETSRGQSPDPVEHYAVDVCEDCRGTGNEWI